MQENGIYAIQTTNAVHQFLLNDLMVEGIQIIRCTGSVRELAKYRFPPIITKPTLIIIDKLDTSAEVANLLTNMSLKRRTIVFDTKSPKELYFLKDIKIGGQPIEMLPQYKEWSDKSDICAELLISTGVEFQTTKVYNHCIKLMIRTFDTVAQTMTDIRFHAKIGSVISSDTLEEIFKDSEIVSLQEWCITMLMNEASVKPVKELHYFLTVKQYAPHWLFEQIKQTIIDIGLVYEARWQGIVLSENVRENVKTRAEVVKSPYTPILSKFSNTQWKVYLKFAATVDYRTYLKIQRVAMNTTVSTAEELYKFLFMVRAQREEGWNDATAR